MKRRKSIGQQSKANVEKVRQIVYARDNHQCVASKLVAGATPLLGSASGCQGSLTIQHAVTRGMGGSARWDSPEYLRAMCAFHNFLDTSDAPFHDLCLENGWTLKRWQAERTPTNWIPVRYFDGWFVLVGGDRIEITERLALHMRELLND